MIEPSVEMISEHSLARSAAQQACSSRTNPPASSILYSSMIERHNVAPVSPKLVGGSLAVLVAIICEAMEILLARMVHLIPLLRERSRALPPARFRIFRTAPRGL